MTTKVVTVTPDMQVSEIARTLVENRISAVPVVDQGKVVGIVSEGDLMRRPETGTEPHHSWWLRMFEMPEEHAAEYVKTHGQSAADVMTTPAVTVEDTASVAEIAETLERRHVKRVPVVAGGNLVGIVSRANLIQALAGTPTPPLAKSEDDRALRQRVTDAIEADVRSLEPFLNVIVMDGKVDLWGAVESENEKKAVRIAAEVVAGKANVRDHVGVLSPTERSVLWAE